MRSWNAEQIARAAGARLRSAPGDGADPPPAGPERAIIDSREAGPGTLFIGLKGRHADGGAYAARALEAGAWGVLTAPEHAERAAAGRPGGVVIAAEDPLAALHRLATSWRRGLGAEVIGVTGSTGKTSTKDLLFAVLAPHRRTVASRANFNTEIGLPLEILAAPAGTEILVLEMAMRGAGQIAELAGVAEPDVGVIVSIGPVHLELLGSVEAVAGAKAELLASLAPGAAAGVPAGERLLAPHLRDDLETISFGEGGDVRLIQGDAGWVEIDAAGETIELEVNFEQAHLRQNLLAAVAAARAVGVTPHGRVELALSPGRGQRQALPGDVTLINDCYNANPMSMRAALDELAAAARREGRSRKVAVLGDMLELGPAEDELHREVGEHADCTGVDVLVTVGPRAQRMVDRFEGEAHAVADAAAAAEVVPGLLRHGDIVLVKGSRAVGLELVCGALRSETAA